MSETEKNLIEADRLIKKAVKQGKADYMLGYIKGSMDAEEKHAAEKKGK